MGYEERADLRISGAGSAGGGTFNEVRISGAGKISGDIDCNLLNSSGASEIKGNVKAMTVKTNGASQIRGNLIASEDVEINGGSNVDGNVEAKNIKIHGGAEIRGNLQAANVDIMGGIKIKGDCEAENFKSQGGFTIGGLLNADSIYINIGGACRAKEIGGEKIEVRRSDKAVYLFQKMIKDIFNVKEDLTTDTIEGDEIYIEYTTAKVVRGTNVTVGPGCSIDLVEYKDHVNISQSAVVNEQKKM
jgi:cytoskeletal protein CcmA (bactofilin family)